MSLNAQVNAINSYLGTTVGREKLCRFVQYFARFYAFYLYRKGAPKPMIERWSELKQHIGNGRKFFRLLKPIEFVQTAAHSLGAQDEILRLTSVVKHLGNALYYSSEVFVLVKFFFFFLRCRILLAQNNNSLTRRRQPLDSTNRPISTRSLDLDSGVGLSVCLRRSCPACTSLDC